MGASMRASLAARSRKERSAERGMTMESRARYIPKDAEAIEHPDGLGIVYLYHPGKNAERLAAIAYRGKAGRSAWHYAFRNREEAEQAARNFFASLSEWKVRQAEWRADRNRPHSLAVGDIVYNSWGYDQTNIDFYAVVRASEHFVWLRPLKQQTEETGFMSGRTRPIIGQFASEEVSKHHATENKYGPSVTFEHGAGCKWDGRAMGCSWYA
jgi:hypothetical protein